MEQIITESDWKLFRSRISDWQERFMGKLVCEYTDLLTDASKLSSDKFWELERRIKGDKKLKGVTCEMSRSTMIYNLMDLYHEGAIDDSDLDGFNDELVRRVKDAAKW